MTRRNPSLEELAAELRDARAALARCRHGAVTAEERTARIVLLEAVSTYVSALERRRLPVPPGLQRDLRTLRAAEGR